RARAYDDAPGAVRSHAHRGDGVRNAGARRPYGLDSRNRRRRRYWLLVRHGRGRGGQGPAANRNRPGRVPPSRRRAVLDRTNGRPLLRRLPSSAGYRHAAATNGRTTPLARARLVGPAHGLYRDPTEATSVERPLTTKGLVFC